MQDPELWSNPDQAKKVGQELRTLRSQVESFNTLNRQIEDLGVRASLEQEDPAGLNAAELAQEAEAAHRRLQQLELMTLLGEQHDPNNAILSVHAGAGGTDSQDWAQMLLRMYTRWAERRGFSTEVVDLSPGEEAGVKSATVILTGPYAYGYLKGERGVHRLVRLSPFDAAHRRHTSFALVDVIPDVEEVEVTIREDELKIETYRGRGAERQQSRDRGTDHPPAHRDCCAVSERTLPARESSHRHAAAACETRGVTGGTTPAAAGGTPRRV